MTPNAAARLPRSDADCPVDVAARFLDDASHGGGAISSAVANTMGGE